MPPRWKPHTALLRAAFMEGLARRKTAMFAFLGNLAWLIIPYYIWHHVYVAKHMVGGFTWNEMRTYIFGSSVKFMGELWLRKLAKCMI